MPKKLQRKGGGMSIKQVADQIKKNYKVRLVLDAKGSGPANLTAADLTTLLTWHQHIKVAGMNKATKVQAWKDIVDNHRQPPFFSRWTEDDERKLAEACQTTVDIGHTALGRMEEMKKKELVLVAATMSNEEFEALRRGRERQLNSLEQREDAPAAESETTNNFTTEATVVVTMPLPLPF